MNRFTLVIAALVPLSAGCGKKTDEAKKAKDEATAKAGSGAQADDGAKDDAAKAAAAKLAGGARLATADKEYTLIDREVTVKLKLVPPKDSLEQVESSFLNFQGPQGLSGLYIGITCHGDCDSVDKARSNIKAQADERFAYFQAHPPLEPTWVRPLAEDPPGLWSWRIHAAGPDGKVTEDTLSFDRIVPSDPTSTKILTCKARFDLAEPALVDQIDQLCRDLVFEVVPAPATPPPPPP